MKKISQKKQAKIMRNFAKSIDRGDLELMHVKLVPVSIQGLKP